MDKIEFKFESGKMETNFLVNFLNKEVTITQVHKITSSKSSVVMPLNKLIKITDEINELNVRKS